eukprot:04899.XXX_84641_87361_1 [CDS] Oithona nana genome sequencing.
MGCGPSSEGQDVWAQSTQKVPLHQPMEPLPHKSQIISNGHAPDLQGRNIDPTVSPDVLERYIELEEKISTSEKDTPAMVLEQKNEQLKQLTIRISEQTKLVEQLKAQAQSGKSVQSMLDNQPNDQDVEQIKDSMAAVHSQEIATKELDSLKEQRNNVDNELRECQYKYEQLQVLYTEQEDLLSQIFGGAYGSEEENRLESIFDQTEEMRNRIIEANFKWRQAQMMVDYAHKQLEFAVQKWKDIDEIDPGALEDRYAVAAETRNNLVAASQNIQGAQRYLSNIQFPYCAPSEVDTLNKATAYIFTDMQTKERHGHALECYYVTSRRCGALLQWITQVVTQTISRDLDDINAKVKEASYNLRAERVRLIKLKVKEVLGKDVDVKIGEFNTDAVVNLNLNDLAKTEGIDPKTLQELNLSEEELAALAALNNGDELAPPPNSDQLFGEKMEAIKKEYEDDNQRYQKLLEKDKAEMNRNLEDKLASRRQRRARKNLEEKEKAVMI